MNNDNTPTMVPLIGGLLVALLLVLVGPFACTVSPTRAQSTFNAYGFTEVQISSFSPFSCGDDYAYSSAFTAKNPAGQAVSDQVCCGVYKGCTLKF